MKATKIFHDKMLFPDGHIAEMLIWKLPEINTERPHGLKYRLFYGNSEERIVGYDNERGKGDHRHMHGQELHYEFVSVEQLLEDFFTDVETARGQR